MLWVFHWGRNSFIPPMKHLIYKMKSFFYELKSHFARYFVSLQCQLKPVLTLSFAFSKITEKKLANPRMGKPTFFLYSSFNS